VDADGSGRFESAREYAQRVVEANHGELKSVVAALSNHDPATAAQAAGILRHQQADGFENRMKEAMEFAAPSVRRGIEAYLKDQRN
jgi:hypothetical protein